MKTLVTGANGHLGANLVRALLNAGREVRAMVRDRRQLRGILELDVEVVEADLLAAQSVERAVEGCERIFHAAAPYALWSPDPQATIIRPITLGTRNLLHAASISSVQRLVFVSTALTVRPSRSFYNDHDERLWNDDARTAYISAKMRAERHAHRYFRETGLPLVFVLPEMMLGPHDYNISPSTRIIKDFLDGRAPFCPPGGLGIADVRDVAQGMLLAEERGRLGERYILGGDGATMDDIYRTLADLLGIRRVQVPIGRGAAYVAGLFLRVPSKFFGFRPITTPEEVHDFVARYYNFPSTKARRELGYAYRPRIAVLRDTVSWLVEQGLVRESVRRLWLARP